MQRHLGERSENTWEKQPWRHQGPWRRRGRRYRDGKDPFWNSSWRIVAWVWWGRRVIDALLRTDNPCSPSPSAAQEVEESEWSWAWKKGRDGEKVLLIQFYFSPPYFVAITWNKIHYYPLFKSVQSLKALCKLFPSSNLHPQTLNYTFFLLPFRWRRSSKTSVWVPCIQPRSIQPMYESRYKQCFQL